MLKEGNIIIVSDVAGVLLKGANSDKAYSNLAERTGIPEASIRSVLRTHRGESTNIEMKLGSTINHDGIERAMLLRMGFENFWQKSVENGSGEMPLNILKEFTTNSLMMLAAGYGLNPNRMPFWDEIKSIYQQSFQVDDKVLGIYKKMREKGHIIGALTNGRSWRLHMLRTCFPEVFKVFNGVIMSSHEFENEGDLKLNPEGIKKPAQRIFKKYQERTKLLHPEIENPLFVKIDDNKKNIDACAALPNWAGYHFIDSIISPKQSATERLEAMVNAFGWI